LGHRASGAVARVLAATGYPEEAEDVVRSIDDAVALAQEVTALVPVMVAAGDVERVEVLIQMVYPPWRAAALSALARALATGGDTARAAAVADRAEATARASGGPRWQAAGLIAVAQAVVVTDDIARVKDLAAQVKALAQTIGDPHWQAQSLAGLAQVMAAIGATAEAEPPLAMAERILRSTSWPDEEAVIEGLAAIGRSDRAEVRAHSLADTPYAHARALTAVAKHVSPDRARRLVVQAFQAYDWLVPLSALAKLQPTALAALADDFLSR
jgi:hypothetical protein